MSEHSNTVTKIPELGYMYTTGQKVGGQSLLLLKKLILSLINDAFNLINQGCIQFDQKCY